MRKNPLNLRLLVITSFFVGKESAFKICLCLKKAIFDDDNNTTTNNNNNNNNNNTHDVDFMVSSIPDILRITVVLPVL